MSTFVLWQGLPPESRLDWNSFCRAVGSWILCKLPVLASWVPGLQAWATLQVFFCRFSLYHPWNDNLRTYAMFFKENHSNLSQSWNVVKHSTVSELGIPNPETQPPTSKSRSIFCLEKPLVCFYHVLRANLDSKRLIRREYDVYVIRW